ncbi:MAG TPA: ABC transporter substrate-binding protein, partial [Myxococcales bacterium]|nr:ABC transporter substrate-binding protein [Myxococcales bacterium]
MKAVALAKGEIAAALLVMSFACVRQAPPPPHGVMTVSVEQLSSFVRNFNPITPAVAPRWPTLCGVYEPLIVFNSVKGEYVPWLAESYEWLESGKVLRFHIRHGVRWSDGQPFSARDVAFTFGLLKKFSALDRSGVWGFVSRIEALDDFTVDFEFPRIFLPGLYEIAPQPIVPEHIWKDVADPVTFANENPIATGPFTEVRVFQNQVYELGKNPYYWQPGKPKVEALRFPAYPSNERANLALIFDEADWAANFVPAVDRVYAKRNPEHHKYWFPLTGSTVFLYANTARPPFDDIRVRKALSLAIDRELLVQVADYGYTRPADATGLSDAYTKWRNPAIAATGDWVAHDVKRAAALLDQAGFALGADGVRRDAKGRELRYEVLSVSGWSDWVRAAQVIARGLREVGVVATVRTYDFAAWFQRVQEGDFNLSIGWSMEGPTPYTFYRWQMSNATKKPLGTPTTA